MRILSFFGSSFRSVSSATGLISAMILASAISACGPSYPNCGDDDDCKQGEFCVNNTCQMCRDNDDCPAGQQCEAGMCDPIPGYCASSDECGSDEECVNNRCSVRQQSVAPAEPPPVAAPACQIEPVYFDFDSSTLSDQSRQALNTAVQCIRERGYENLHLTGMTDPRGTAEYNLALGDRRAKAAQTYLKSLGLQGRLSTSSMGQEMARGHDESGWARDRRVEIQPR